MRSLLRRLILWALSGAPETVNDAAGLDKIASQQETTGVQI